MRITKEMLVKLAKEAVSQRAEKDKNITAAFLLGSVLTNADPFLGGATDIDVLFLCENSPVRAREFVKLNKEITLDLMYALQGDFEPPRKQRAHPWRGYVLYDPLPLYETQHFFEYAQSSLRAGFDEPNNVIARARYFSAPARQQWMKLSLNAVSFSAESMQIYLLSVYDAAQAVAALSGAPLSDRRLLLDFPTRAEAIGKPEFTGKLFSLLGADKLISTNALSWLPDWQASLQTAIDRNADGRFHALRLPYYANAIKHFLESERPGYALWLLLETWTTATLSMSTALEPAKNWQHALEELGFSPEFFGEKLTLLDGFLDSLEEMLEAYAVEHGVSA